MTDKYESMISDQTYFTRTVVEMVTVRDQFAMAALPALMADPESVAYPIGHAKLAYEYADAMLEARKEKK